MTGIAEKAAHVRAAVQTRNHTCHWPGCGKSVPPAMFACTRHWFMLPKSLQRRIWAAYRIGQEEDGNPSAAYLAVVRETLAWIRENAA